jgi:hypothetical protein
LAQGSPFASAGREQGCLGKGKLTAIAIDAAESIASKQALEDAIAKLLLRSFPKIAKQGSCLKKRRRPARTSCAFPFSLALPVRLPPPRELPQPSKTAC